MATTIRTKRYLSPTSNGTADYTISGFGTPKAVMVHASYAASNATARDQAKYSVGYTDGTRQRVMGFASEHNLSVGRSRFWSDNDKILQLVQASGSTTLWLANFDSWITDGVRLNFTSTESTAIYLTVTFFTGSDVSVYAGDFTNNTTQDATTTVTSPGFTPDLLFVTGLGLTLIANQSSNVASFSEGVADLGTGFPQGSLAWTEDYNDAKGDPQALFEDRYVGQVLDEDSEAQSTSIEITATDSSGFVATTRVAGGSYYWSYLAIKVGTSISHEVGNITTPTSTGNRSDTDPGFQPQIAGFVMSTMSATETYKADGEAGAFGSSVFEATAERNSHALAMEDNVQTTNTQSYSENVPVVLPIDDGSAGLRATFVSFDTNGWTLNWTAVLSPTARYFLWWAIEQEAGATIVQDIISPGIIPFAR